MPLPGCPAQGAFTPGGAQPSEVVEGEEAAVPATPAAHRENGNGSGNVRVLAKPPVRKLAKDLGIDLRELTPTGSDGTVTREDVNRAAEGHKLTRPSGVPRQK